MKRVCNVILIYATICLSLIISSPAESLIYVPYDAHLAIAFDPQIDVLALEDGSEWKVPSSYFSTFSLWNLANRYVPVEIVPNFLSARYPYYIINQETGSYVKANLLRAPSRYSPYAVTISEFNRYDKGLIYLSNGTFWHISSFDLDWVQNWYEEDLIIIGKNTEWLSWNTHILINIHTNTYVRAKKI